MSIAQKIAQIIPRPTRIFLKQHFPNAINFLVIAVDSTRKIFRRTNINWQAHQLFEKMRAGFGNRVEELEQLKFSTPSRSKKAASAAWYLARWQAQNGDYRNALSNMLLATAANPKLRKHLHIQILTVECLLQLDRPEDAERWLKWASKKKPSRFSADLNLMTANIRHAGAIKASSSLSADNERLELLNEAYKVAGFSEIEKIDKAAPLTLDNIRVPHPRPVNASAKLSVLVPAYNCANTLTTALTSILNQTWNNLEVVIVDDRSQDDTWRVIQEFAKRDSRIVPVRHELNGGAYAARNTALGHATGEFVTVHDADDWSHPEKFTAQMLYAVSHPDSISTTAGVRVSHDLRFRTSTGAVAMLMQNLSSLLLRRELLVELGGWDRTRVAADSELYERVRAKYNLKTNVLFPSTPLTLILLAQTSLTQSSATGLSSLYYGARRQYKEAYRFWHACERARSEPNFRITDTRRFPAPRIVLGQREPIKDIDLIITANFADTGQSFEEHLAMWRALSEAGLRLGIIHWPAYEAATASIAPSVRGAIAAGLVENIVPGETVSCKTVIVLEAGLLADPPSPLPAVSTEHMYVVTDGELLPSWRVAAERYFSCTPLAIGRKDLARTLGI